MGIKFAGIMAQAFSVEIRLCHDSGDCLADLARDCFSWRRKDLLAWYENPLCGTLLAPQRDCVARVSVSFCISFTLG
jgi:hypothetical protein